MATRYIVVGCFAFLCFVICTTLALDISKDQRYDQNGFFTYKQIQSYLVCGMLCVQSSRCEGFNFKTANSSCSLIDQIVNSTVVSEVGYLSSDIANWDVAISGSCETKPCDSSSFCVPGTSDYNCITAGWAIL